MSPADKPLVWLHEENQDTSVLGRSTGGGRSYNWRILYRTDADAVVIVEVWNKTTRATPQHVIAQAKRRLRLYDGVAGKFRRRI